MSHAVIKTGGKQYLVQKGDVVKVEKLPEEEGKKVAFKEVLLAGSDKKISLGTPIVKGATVEGKVLAQDRHDKVWGVKMKPKKRNRKLFGHKQAYTEIEITKVTAT